MPREPSPQRDRAHLYDIADGIRRARRYVAEMNQETFESDLKTQDALIRRLIIIGEATKRLSAETRRCYPDVPWEQMAGMRDVIVHDYDRIDLDVVWNVVQHELPRVAGHLQHILDEGAG